MKILKAEVLETEKPRFVGWAKVPDTYKTKTQWNKEGMRLKSNVEPAAYVYAKARNTHYELYSCAEVEPKTKQRPGEPLHHTPENIGAALYEINKAAKRRRDAAQRAYDKGAHGLAGNHRQEKKRLYDLKDRVIRKAFDEGLSQLVGYHSKKDRRNRLAWVYDGNGSDDCDHEVSGWDDDDFDELPDGQSSPRRIQIEETTTTNMICYELAGFRFHVIVEQIPKDAVSEIEDLGEWISKATPRTKHMTLKVAEATLKRYLTQERTTDAKEE